jgi:glycosyltransferase involved in cell wall biosynthesis
MAKIRVAQAVVGLGRGGIEQWVLDVLGLLDRDRFEMDLLVSVDNPEVYGDAARRLGSRVILCPGYPNLWRYGRSLRRALREYGPYDVVHAQLHHLNGFALRVAKQQGVKGRIAHSHVDSRPADRNAGLVRRWLVYPLLRRWLLRSATHGLAVSKEAGESYFGASWGKDPRFRTLYCGIKTEQFYQPVDPAAVRAELGIPPGAFVVGHVGRFMEQKNHVFLIRIAAEVFRRQPNAYLLLIGEGHLEPAVVRQVAELGLNDRVIFAGVRTDVPRLLRGAMDVFVLPSLFEGLPLVGLEVQAAGLPWVCTDNIAGETFFAPELVERHSLGDPPAAWAEALLALGAGPRKVGPAEALARLERSPFPIRESVRRLQQLYEDALR